MSRIAYVNGQYVPHLAAAVHVEDRGYQFADAVYEVCEVVTGCLVDETLHLARLERSLNELRMPLDRNLNAVSIIMREVVKKNRVTNGIVYLQISRGVSARNHKFPTIGTPLSLVVTAKNVDPNVGAQNSENGVKVITVSENRWERVDIKSVSLLPNVLAKQLADDAGAYEAWFVDEEGFVTEGSSTNAWIITNEGKLVTRPANGQILRGITRTVLLNLCRRENIEFEERAFTVEESYTAREAFVTAATSLVMPVVQINDRIVANGKPGSIATKLRQIFHSQAELASRSFLL